MLGSGACGHDGALLELHLCARGDFESDDVVVDILHLSVDAADGDNVLAHGEGVAEFLDFLLLLVLGTNHEEIYDGEEYNHHNNHFETAATSGSAKALASVIGEDELNKGVAKVKSMKEGVETEVALSEIIEYFTV